MLSLKKEVVKSIILHNLLTMWEDTWQVLDAEEEEEVQDHVLDREDPVVVVVVENLRVKVQNLLLNWYYTKQI